MDASIPTWAQQIGVLAVAIMSVIVGVYKYFKAESGKITPKPVDTAANQQVVAASFLDSRLIKELIDTLREHMEEYARENKKLTRSNQDVREAVCELTEATIVNTDSQLNMVRFLKTKSLGEP